MTNAKHKPHLRPCGIVDETGEPLFYYRDLDVEQREAERQAEARKVTRYRIGSDGKLETRRFELAEVGAGSGWLGNIRDQGSPAACFAAANSDANNAPRCDPATRAATLQAR